MPIHDWTKVPPGLYHDFHQRWSIAIADALNQTLLPEGLSALVESRSHRRESDIMTIEAVSDTPAAGGTALSTLPRTRHQAVLHSDAEHYAMKANRIVIYNRGAVVISVLEIVSPGNKSGQRAFREFIKKSTTFLRNGVHLSVIDPFPPTRRDRNGIHAAIWNEFTTETFRLTSDKPLVNVAYSAGEELRAFIEPVAVGDALPDLPLFLAPERHVPLPLESTYNESWRRTPSITKNLFG